MTAVGRPDNGQDEGRWRVTNLVARDTGETLVTDGDLVVGYFHRRQDAERAVAAVNSARPGAGEQQRAQVAKYLADGIAQYVGSFMSCMESLRELRAVDFQYMAEDFIESCDIVPELLGLLSHTDDEAAEPCPSRSHGSDGWHCAVEGPHGDGQHSNAAGDATW